MYINLRILGVNGYLHLSSGPLNIFNSLNHLKIVCRSKIKGMVKIVIKNLNISKLNVYFINSLVLKVYTHQMGNFFQKELNFSSTIMHKLTMHPPCRYQFHISNIFNRLWDSFKFFQNVHHQDAANEFLKFLMGHNFVEKMSS